MQPLKDFAQRHFVSLILGAVLLVVFVFGEFNRGGDFATYLEVAEALFNDELIYQRLYGPGELFEVFVTPFLAWFLYPFALLPLPLASALWKLLNILLLLRCWHLIGHYLDLKSWSVKQLRWMQALVFISIVFPIYDNLHMGQLTILLLYLGLEAMHQLNHRNNLLLGALLLAIGVFVKIILIVFLPYLLYRKRFRTFAVLVLALFALFALPATVVGWEQNLALWQDWLGMIDPSSSENRFDMNNRKNHGISALIASLFIEGIRNGESSVYLRRHLIDLDPMLVERLILAARLAIASAFLFFLRWPPFQKAPSRLHQLWELSYLFLVIPLIFPQQRPYNFLFLLPAFAYFLYFIRTKTSYKSWYAIVFYVLVFSINLQLTLGDFRNHYWHFKSLTYIALISGVLLFWLSPKRLHEKSTDHE